MKEDFVEELRWRGLLQDIMPGTEELLKKETVTGYIGFDPTADSLHIGSLTQIFTLIRFQRAGHKPIALVGGATGMVGDPSGKSAERNLLDEEALNTNVEGIKKQLQKFLDFSDPKTGAELVNNYDWMRGYTFLEFIRDIGKHITVNYMMAKDSVKNRINPKRLNESEEIESESEEESGGMSFTEFTYQLIQGYDFYWLWKNKDVKIQMGGSDQFGNITTGTQLIRRKGNGKAWGLTTQLVKKADGTKFGKTESGNIWLDAEKTSPFRFYQFWLNTSDDDAINFIKIFTFHTKEETENLIAEHNKDRGKRVLQKTLAKELSILVHSEEKYNAAVEASNILFNGGIQDLIKLDDTTFLEVFDGMDKSQISRTELETGIAVLDLLAEKTNVFPSKSEARKMIQGGGVKINKEKVETHELMVDTKHLVKNKYIIIQKGKGKYNLCSVN